MLVRVRIEAQAGGPARFPLDGGKGVLDRGWPGRTLAPSGERYDGLAAWPRGRGGEGPAGSGRDRAPRPLSQPSPLKGRGLFPLASSQPQIAASRPVRPEPVKGPVKFAGIAEKKKAARKALPAPQ